MISVIVPVYNSENTICKCVESILSQTYSDLELVLVDDGSRDDSYRICSEYTYDTRVTVIHKENGGVSSARNAGLDIAKGEWVTFVDSDDWVEEDFLQSLLDSSENVDFVASTFNGEKEIPFSYVSRDDGSDIIYQFLRSKLSMSPWAKLFRKSVIDTCSLRFDPQLFSGEDTVFVWTYLAYSRSVTIVAFGFYMFTGTWGDTKKYCHQLESLSILIRKEVEALLKVKTHWHMVICDLSLAWSIQYLDGLYSKYTDIDIFELFCRLIQPIEKTTYFRHLFLSQSLQGILTLKHLYATGHFDDARNLMADLSRYFTVPASETSLKATNKVLYFFLYHNMRLTAHLMLKSWSLLTLRNNA